MAESDRKPAAGEKKPLSWTITPVEPKGSVIGATLRVAREERGLSIADVAAVLKIRNEHIASIEQGRTNDLPGSPYAIGFVRTYAEYLGMDGLDAVRRFKEEVAKPEDDGELAFPVPIADRKFPTALLIAGVVILAAALYGVWYFFSGDEPKTADAPAAPAKETIAESSAEAEPAAAAAPASPAPDAQADVESEATPMQQADTEEESASPTEPAGSLAAPAAQPAAASDADSNTADAATEGAATETAEKRPSSSGAAETEAPPMESESPASPSTSPPAAPPPPPVAEAPATTAVPTVEGQAAPSEAAPAPTPESAAGSAAQIAAAPSAGQGAPGPSRIELRATSDSWVVIRDAKSKVLFARVLGVGESYSVPSLPNLSMVTGNAGALDIYVDGRIIKPLGPMGAVRRDVVLDPEKLLARQ